MTREQVDKYGPLTLLIVSAALRFPRLGSGGFWLDEVMTAWRVIDLPTTITLNDGSPPFYPFLVWLSKTALGESEWTLRFPSAVAGSLLPPAMFVLLRRQLPLLTCAVAAAFMAFSPLSVYYAQEARAYSFLALVTVLFSAFCWLLISAPEAGGSVNRVHGLAAFLSGVAMVLSHNYGVFMAVAVAIVALIHTRHLEQPSRGSTVRGLALMMGLLALTWLAITGPNVMVFSAWVREAVTNNPVWPRFSVWRVAHGCLTTPVFNNYSLIAHPVAQACLGSAVLIWVAFFLPPRHPGRYWGQVCLLVVVLTVANDWRIPNFVSSRYEFGYAPVFLTTTALAVTAVPWSKIRLVLLVLLLGPFVTWNVQNLAHPSQVQSATKDMASLLARENVQAVFVTVQRRFDPLYLGSLTYYLHHRMGLAIPVIEIPRFQVVPDGFLSTTHYYKEYPELVAITAEQQTAGMKKAVASFSSIALIGRPPDLGGLFAAATDAGLVLQGTVEYPSYKDRGVGVVVLLRRPGDR